jgi:hypothetical protein
LNDDDEDEEADDDEDAEEEAAVAAADAPNTRAEEAIQKSRSKENSAQIKYKRRQKRAKKHNGR